MLDCFVLVIFVLVIFSLLGMQLFSVNSMCALCTARLQVFRTRTPVALVLPMRDVAAGCHRCGGSGCGFLERLGQHFATFDSSMLLLFQVLTGEDWVNLLEMGMAGNQLAAALFFVAYYIFVVYVLLNIFVALIMDAFSVHDDIKVERQGEQYIQQYGRLNARQALLARGRKVNKHKQHKMEGELMGVVVDEKSFNRTQKIVLEMAGPPTSTDQPSTPTEDASRSLTKEKSAGFEACTLHVRGIAGEYENESLLGKYFSRFGEVVQVTVRAIAIRRSVGLLLRVI